MQLREHHQQHKCIAYCCTHARTHTNSHPHTNPHPYTPHASQITVTLIKPNTQRFPISRVRPANRRKARDKKTGYINLAQLSWQHVNSLMYVQHVHKSATDSKQIYSAPATLG